MCCVRHANRLAHEAAASSSIYLKRARIALGLDAESETVEGNVQQEELRDEYLRLSLSAIALKAYGSAQHSRCRPIDLNSCD